MGRARWLVARAFKALESRGASLESLVLVAVAGFIGWIRLLPDGIAVACLLGAVAYEFQKRLDQGLPLMQVAAVLATLQWVVGPWLAFWIGYDFDRYRMYVTEERYFAFAIPGCAAFVFGLLSVGSSVRMRELLEELPREHFMGLGLLLGVCGVAARLAAPMVPSGLSFAVFLVSQITYVGIIYVLYSRAPYRWWLAFALLLPQLRQTAEAAMFHDLLLWLGLLFCFWFCLRKHTTGAKLALISVAGIALFSIQAIKESYRSKVWSGQDVSLSNEVYNFWLGGGANVRDALPNVVMRLNQGWIVSAVLNHVPRDEPFADGETVVEALRAAFLPRFLDPDKATSGGRENFRRFTGLDIGEGTSMAISPLGEAYANYGKDGAILCMLLFGVVFSLGYSACLRWAVRWPDFVFWIPLIFYQAIKAETEFVTVLNQVTKGAVIAFGLHWAIHAAGLTGGRRKPVRDMLNGERPDEVAGTRVAP